ncbi:type II toxin-antitoxin system PemK/MazF family toxin [Candidatus Woesearchaeota archaeon]|nr:type II toxin-antitoxin system PemK/MazF family toxin [Candidatus Woesearchaeota archaeon]
MKGGMMYEQGDIVFLPFPYSDLTAAKQRPALIISNSTLNHTEDRICCLITSNKPKDGILINSFEKGSLPFESWVKPYRLFTVNTKIIRNKICKVSKHFHDQVIAEIEKYLS